jgi:hypothetical protein
MRASACLAIFAAIFAIGCGPTVDLKKGLQILDVSTGWYDAGIVDGQNKLVPQISFKLKNVSNRTLYTLQVNALFRHGDDKEEWGSAFATVAGSSGLAPGATTGAIVLRSPQGYKSTEPRQQMLQNSHFVDAKVELSAKYESTQWTRIGDYKIDRKLITP